MTYFVLVVGVILLSILYVLVAIISISKAVKKMEIIKKLETQITRNGVFIQMEGTSHIEEREIEETVIIFKKL